MFLDLSGILVSSLVSSGPMLFTKRIEWGRIALLPARRKLRGTGLLKDLSPRTRLVATVDDTSTVCAFIPANPDARAALTSF